MYPIIITAPHAKTTIDDPSLRQRIRLTDFEIWKCSDPFTSELKDFTCAAKKHIAKTHRLICDLNRAPDPTDCFHTKDFFGRSVFKPGKGLSQAEKKQLIRDHWYPFHEAVEQSIVELDKTDPGVILVVDYHNTSGDHPLGADKRYMPGFILSDLDGTVDANTGKVVNGKLLPKKYLKKLKENLEDQIHIPVETNEIYHGGFDMKWYLSLKERLNLKSKLYAVQIEYNLDFIVNPITQKLDKKALSTMQKALNKALEKTYQSMTSY